MQNIKFYGWKIDTKTRELFIKLKDTINKLLPKELEKIDIEMVDLAVYGSLVHNRGWGLAFGKAINVVSNENGQVLSMPEAHLLLEDKVNTEYRKTGFSILKILVEELSAPPKKENGIVTAYIEMPDGVTVGTKDADIVIPSEVIKGLLEMRDLLTDSGKKMGGKIIFKQGDKQIEIG